MKKVNGAKLLKAWRALVGKTARCKHTGRVGTIDKVWWQNRYGTGGDWGVFVGLRDERGEFSGRPAFLEVDP